MELGRRTQVHLLRGSGHKELRREAVRAWGQEQGVARGGREEGEKCFNLGAPALGSGCRKLTEEGRQQRWKFGEVRLG